MASCMHWLLVSVFIGSTVYFHTATTSSDILIMPYASEGSHYFVMKSIADELSGRGWHVTMLLNGLHKEAVMSKANPAIQYEFHKPNFTRHEEEEFFTGMTNAGLRGEYISWIMEFINETTLAKSVSECHNILDDVNLMTRLKQSKFKVALFDFGVECPLLQLLKHEIGLPFIAVSAVVTRPALLTIQNRMPYNPAYIPEIMTGFDHQMSFYDRLLNTLLSMLFASISASIANPFQDTYVKYGIADASPQKADAEIWLMNTHFAFDFPRPFLPNTKAVGGLTTRQAKSLPNDLQDFLQDAGDHGVILFSMGTYARGIDSDIAAMFAGAFAQIPQKVIWKLSGEPSASVSDNVRIMDWIPQNDLLGHPQLKAFVTHCGVNGVWEAIYHGVPMVAIPLFGDQPDNAQRIVSRGIGVRVDITTLTSDQLAQAIRTVTEEPSYEANAKQMSELFRDTRRTPLQQAADWTEYVIRHGNARHLRSVALDLNIMQYFLLDVVLCLCIGLSVFVFLIVCSCRLCYKGCQKLCGRDAKVKMQ